MTTAIIIIIILSMLKKTSVQSFVSPVVFFKIRNDTAGRGTFGAPRGQRTHKGLDLVVTPRESVYSPFDGKLVRIVYPYKNDTNFTGVVLRSKTGQEMKIFYMSPDKELIGKNVKAGQIIGRAQDVRKKYPDSPAMLPHLHIELREGTTLLNPLKYFKNENNV